MDKPVDPKERLTTGIEVALLTGDTSRVSPSAVQRIVKDMDATLQGDYNKIAGKKAEVEAKKSATLTAETPEPTSKRPK